MIKGVDVSSYQSATFSTKGLDFAFIKATEGTSYINPRMTAQAKHARAAGLVVGFYHFLRPGDMKKQAAYFVEQAASIEGDPLFADWEDSGVSCAQKDQFIREVQRLRGKTHRVGLYCNADYWTNRDTSSFAGDALWIAQYGAVAGKPSIKAKWLFHQYTDKPLDTNMGQFADRAALAKWAGIKVTEPKYQPFPGADWFKSAPASDVITAMGERLVDVGCSRYAEGPGRQWTEADRKSYAAWQRKCGYSGAAADGWPGRKSWDALKVPYTG